MILYASATGTRRNLFAMSAHGWRLLFSAAAPSQWRAPGWRYGLDNGAWSSHTRGVAWDPGRFRAAVDELACGADWVIAPDIVAGGLPSLRLSESWIPRLVNRCRRVLIPVQDGIEPRDVASLLSDRVGIAIGGSTAWKVHAIQRPCWLELARSRDAWAHVLRVNTCARIDFSAGYDSIDGSSASRYAVSTPLLTKAAQRAACQQVMPWS